LWNGTTVCERAVLTDFALRLDATNWLRLNRDAWGIENGLHQRLDISHNDDRCQVRNPAPPDYVGSCHDAALEQ
jgi:hypothetical protein